MSKSNGEHDTAARLLHALIQDWKYVLGDSVTCSLQKDVDWVCEVARTRGLSILMEDMPALCKLFEQTLETGTLEWELWPSSLKRKGGTYVFGSLVSCLGIVRYPGDILRIADQTTLEPDLIQAVRSILLLFKKVEKESSKKAKDAAIRDFVAIDSAIPVPISFWDTGLVDDCPLVEGHRSFSDLVAVGDYSRCATHTLRWVELIIPYLLRQPADWYDMFGSVYPKHGPGSVSDVPSGGDKYRFPSWSEALSTVFDPNMYAGLLGDSPETSCDMSWNEAMVYSRVICVPKTLNKPRVIASEPTANQFCQQMLMGLIRQVVKRNKYLSRVVDFTSQEESRRILLNDSDVATLDLSAASDRLSANAVAGFFRRCPDILQALYATRTKYAKLPDREELWKLRKFAAMGSAVTFPVQSIIYSIVAVASVLFETRGKYNEYSDIKKTLDSVFKKYGHQIQVFGDDIIVPRFAQRATRETLEALGLKVNHAKSFTGFFKESCGMDVYKKTEVTPLYVRSLLPVVSRCDCGSLIDVRNNAYEKGLWNLAREIERQVPSKLWAFIPTSKDPLPGLRRATVLNGDPFKGSKQRWNKDYQRWMSRVLVPRSKQTVVKRDSEIDLFQYLVEHRSGLSQVGFESSVVSVMSLWDLLSRSHSVGWLKDKRTSVDVRWV